MDAANDFPQVVIDGVYFQVGRTGIGRVWTSLLREWAAGDFADRFLFLDRGGTAPPLNGIRCVTISPYAYRFTGYDASGLQALCDRELPCVCVSTYYTAP